MAPRRYPECENCDFFIRNRPELERRCRAHDFIMPRIGWQVICRDWQHNQHNSKRFSRLDQDTLFYYSYDSDNNLLGAPLGTFPALQRLLVGVNIRQDKRLGWVVQPHTNRRYFPQPGQQLAILLYEEEYLFEAAEVERSVAASMIAGLSGKIEAASHSERVYTIYCLDGPTVLYEWLDTFMHLDDYINESFVPSIFAFSTIIYPNSFYTLRPDLLTYGRFVRR
jgi:hypothetical protein